MKLEIKNLYLAESINFLHGISLKGKKSRHRSRFIKMLEEKLEQYREDEMHIIKEYAKLDENGDPVTNNNTYDIENIKGFKADQKELLEEVNIFEGGDATGILKTVKEIIFEYDEEVSGRTAEVYDYLYEAFENSNTKEEENE